LYNQDLLNLFSLVTHLNPTSGTFDPLLLTVASNLKTIAFAAHPAATQCPQLQALNQASHNTEQALKQAIFNQYKQIFARNP
jgi:hypothetical protein